MKRYQQDDHGMIISLIQNEVKAKHWNTWNKINVILHQARSEAMRWVFWLCEDALALIPQTISLVFVRPQHAKILIARELPLVSCQKVYFSWRTRSRAPFQCPKRRHFVRSRKVSKPRDWYFKFSYRFEFWQAHRQHCYRSACQISERSDNSKYKSRGFETLRDLTKRCLFGYIDGVPIAGSRASRCDQMAYEPIR